MRPYFDLIFNCIFLLQWNPNNPPWHTTGKLRYARAVEYLAGGRSPYRRWTLHLGPDKNNAISWDNADLAR